MSWQYDPNLSRPGVAAEVNKQESLIRYKTDHQALFDYVGAKRGEAKTNDMRMLCEIPADLVNSWAQQGYDIMKMPSDELRNFLKVHNILGSDYRKLVYDHS